MKKAVLFLLLLVLIACNMPLVGKGGEPAVQPPVVLPATLALPSPSPSQSVATTQAPVTPGSTDLTATAAAALTSSMLTLTALGPTPTPTQPDVFSEIKLSADTLSINCNFTSVDFDVTVSDPNIFSVYLFLRLRDKTSGTSTSWSEGTALNPLGNGKFHKTIPMKSIAGYQQFTEAWVQYQLVAAARDQTIISRSQVFGNQLTYAAACP